MPNSFNVGVDVNHFYPIDIDYIVSKVEYAEYESKMRQQEHNDYNPFELGLEGQ